MPLRHRFAWVGFLTVASGMVAGSASRPARAEPAHSPSRSAPNQPQLQERDRLKTEFKKLLAQGKLEEATKAAHKLLVLERKIQGNVEWVADSLELLARVYQQRQDFPQARQTWHEVVELRKELLGDGHWRVVDARLALTHVKLLARLSAAQRRELAEADQFLAKLLELSQQGKFQQAQKYGRQAVAVRKRLLGLEHPDYAHSLHALAWLYDAQKDSAQAEKLYRQGLAVRKKMLGEDHPDYAHTLNNLANVYLTRGEHAKAEPLYERALAIRKKALGEAHPDYGQSLHNLGLFYVAIADYPKAEPLLKQGMEIRKKVLGERHIDYAQSLSALASLHQESGEYSRAERSLRQALEIIEKEWGKQHPDYIVCLEKLTYLYEDKRDYARAEAVCRQVVAIRKQALGEQHSDYGSSLLELALICSWNEDYGKAKALFKQSLLILKQSLPILKKEFGEESSEYANRMGDLALAHYGLGEYAEAEAVLRQWLDKWRGYLRLASVAQSERQQLAATQHFRGNLDLYLSLVLEARQPLGHAYDAVLAWKGAVFARQLRRRLLRQDKDPQVVKLHDRLRSTAHQLAKLAFAAPAAKDSAAWKRRLADLTDEKESLEAELVLGDVDYDAAPGKSHAASAGRSAARPRAGSLRKWPELDETGDEIALVRRAFQRRFRKGQVTELTGREATEEALRGWAPRRRWLHLATHAFFAPPELRSALAPARSHGSAGFTWSALGVSLVSALAPARPHQAAAGTADPFSRGGISGFHPGLLSGLVLAGANRPAREGQDDGILTALEVAQLDLTDVELAVLSACETGLGEESAGEGLLGLQRAFQVAGARSVVASLWKVGDKPTRELMVRFYKNLWGKRGMSRVEALREAQLWMLREGADRGLVPLWEDEQVKGKPRVPPHFWAAFQLSGDWR